jgi:hypothetical protein
MMTTQKTVRLGFFLFCQLFCLLWCPGIFASPNGHKPPTMRDFIGINGHTVQFKPELYRPVCGLVRDYHPVEWDLGPDSTTLPPFPKAKNGVDWNQVYGSWRNCDWRISACLMFESLPLNLWKNIETDAAAYGRAFAKEFGPSGKRRLVDSVEIGNEPGKWSDADCARIFKAMASGIREGDPRLQITTCNLTTGQSGEYEISVACLEGSLDLFDVLTIHTYAQLEGWPTWKRSFPEDPRLTRYLQDVETLCRWRDTHAPKKPVWITEFGYDSTTQPSAKTGDFSQWVGVTDTQQAQWLVRSLLVFSSLPVERAYIYFFDDKDQPSVHASAGITRNLQPKPSYHALTHLQKVLGAFRFNRIVANESGKIRVHEYRGPDNQSIWAAWSPTGEERSFLVTLDKTPGKLIEAQRMPLTDKQQDPPKYAEKGEGRVEVEVNESPLYLIFEKP